MILPMTPAAWAIWERIPMAKPKFCENCGEYRGKLVETTVKRSYDPKKTKYMLCKRCRQMYIEAV